MTAGSPPSPASLPAATSDPQGAAILKAWGVEGTFVLFDVAGHRLTATDPSTITERHTPASTFKIANTLIGLETGVITGKQFVVPWDGIQREIPEWNRDHDLASAMKYSVVPYYQEVARRVGPERMRLWLDRLAYGNQDMQGEIDSFWLEGKLAISPLEQIAFLDRLRRRELPVARANMDLVDEVTTLESGPGWAWRGKTGTQKLDGQRPCAWLVGRVDRAGQSWIYALFLTGSPSQDKSPSIGLRRSLVRTLLDRAGVLPLKPNATGAPAPVDMAVTFDDLPRHGPLLPGQTRLSIHQEILRALAKHHIPEVTGFVNGKNAVSPDERAALDAWVSAGQPLGSHTYSHASPHAVSLEAYLRDIDENEPVLARHAQGKSFKTFRFPFLQEGRDLPSRQAIRRHLVSRGYRIAQVTVDFGDWAWPAPYARCMAKHDNDSIASLDKSYMQYARAFLRWSTSAAQQMLGRPIPHVLLLHVGGFQARMLDELLTAYEKEGVRFVSLDEALEDPALSVETDFVGKWGSSLLEQIASTRAVAYPPMPQQPLSLLDRICR